MPNDARARIEPDGQRSQLRKRVVAQIMKCFKTSRPAPTDLEPVLAIEDGPHLSIDGAGDVQQTGWYWIAATVTLIELPLYQMYALESLLVIAALAVDRPGLAV